MKQLRLLAIAVLILACSLLLTPSSVAEEGSDALCILACDSLDELTEYRGIQGVIDFDVGDGVLRTGWDSDWTDSNTTITATFAPVDISACAGGSVRLYYNNHNWSSNGSVELSDGENAYRWDLSKFGVGQVMLPFDMAETIGGAPDLSRIKKFTITNESTHMTFSMLEATANPGRAPFDKDEYTSELEQAAALGLIPPEWGDDYNALVTIREFMNIVYQAVETASDVKMHICDDPINCFMCGMMNNQDAITRDIASQIIILSSMEAYHGFAHGSWFSDPYAICTLNIAWAPLNISPPNPPIREHELSMEGKLNAPYSYQGALYCAMQCDPTSGRTIMEPDSDGWLRTGDYMTRGEAVLAAKRLYYAYNAREFSESAKEYFTAINRAEAERIVALNRSKAEITKDPAELLLTDDMRREYETQFAQRCNAILNTATEIRKSDEYIPGETYTGNAFFVSPNGDDGNDGRTPETAWRTIKNVNEVMWNNGMQHGDAVFFERGGVYRTAEAENSVSVSKPGITFSAYGEGAKPLLTDSEESGVGTEKWELYYEGGDGVRIWKFYRDMRDTAAVVCNAGEVYAMREYEYWDINSKSYLSTVWTPNDENYVDIGFCLADELRPVEETLTSDLTIISRPDLCKHTQYPFTNEGESGPLYFRCDAGNPGELFETVEFITLNICGTFWVQADDTVIDNLNISYAGNSLVKDGLAEFVNGTVIQNCELAFCGGSVVYYSAYEPGVRYTAMGLDGGEPLPIWVQGDALFNFVDATIQNNYFHDLNASAITYEDTSKTPLRSNLLFCKNLVDGSCALHLNGTDANGGINHGVTHLESVILENNMILNTGKRASQFNTSDGVLLMPANYNDVTIIRDNIFWCTENGSDTNGLLSVWCYDYANERFKECTIPIYENNTFVQYAGKPFACFASNFDERWMISDPYLPYMIENLMGMKNYKLYIIPD